MGKKTKKSKLNLSTRCRSWCFTLNNPTDEEEFLLNECFDYRTDYLLYGLEYGKKGTFHLQGFVHFHNVKSGYYMRAYFPNCHIEPMCSTIASCIAYCKKDGNYVEQGEYPQQGKRTDLLGIKATIDNGGGMEAVAHNHFEGYLRYSKSIEKYWLMQLPHRTDAPQVYWFYGSTGSGKSRTAVEFCTEQNLEYYIKCSADKWFDGYYQQPVVIFDDFEYKPSEMSFRFLLNLLDRYQMQVPFKGGFVKFNSPYIIFTADKPPSEVFKRLCATTDFKQFLRRLTDIKLFGTYDEYESTHNPLGQCIMPQNRHDCYPNSGYWNKLVKNNEDESFDLGDLGDQHW